MEEKKEDTNKEVEKVEVAPIHTLPEYVSDFTGYDHLFIMCKDIRNESSSGSGFLNPITPRLKYIMDALSLQGQRFDFVPLNSNHYSHNESTAKSCDVEVDGKKLANVMVSFKGTNQDLPTVIFTAHHDIANSRSENCQDNTASVCNLIHLCAELKEHEKFGELQQNVVVGFTDCEEAGGRGMNMLISQIKAGEYGEVESIFCLELTANGTEMWVTGLEEGSPVANRLSRLDQTIPRVSTPYNESSNAKRAGLPAVCIGTLSPSEMAVATGTGGKYGWGGFPKTWGLCHSMTDTFEHSANQEEMIAFVNMMLGMIDIEEVERIVEVETVEEDEDDDMYNETDGGLGLYRKLFGFNFAPLFSQRKQLQSPKEGEEDNNKKE